MSEITDMSAAECVETLTSEQMPIIELTENGIEGFEILCRLCANRGEHLIPIYSEEGMSNDLSNKMNLYLPVKVTESDNLPLQCCYQCASTVLTWHELVIASVEADRRLRNLQIEAEKHLEEQNNEAVTVQPGRTSDSEDDRPVSSRAACLSPVRQHNRTTNQPARKRRGRPPKNKDKHDSTPKADLDINHTSDGEWIKTELTLEDQGSDPFDTECKLTEEQKIKLTACDDSDNSDFDNLDPEYTPDEYHTKKEHSCRTCDISFEKITEFRKHLKVCQIDDQIKTESDDPILDEDVFHMDLGRKKTVKKMKREYRCDYCPTRTGKKEDLKQHMLDLHPDQLDRFSEKQKRRRSKIDQEAVNRAKVVVDSRTYYHCNECGKNLHSPYTYIWHNRIHTGERPFVCDLCGKQFRVSQGLVRHLRETHAGIKNFPCDLCGRMFATRRNVEEHRRIHTNERPYICDLCGKAFKQKASLFVHNRSHNDSFPFKCSYCNQGFRTRPPLLVHVTRHTGEKPYACDICGRCFRIKYELKRHRLIHSDDKPFSCEDCGISFRQKRYLRNHNKINHNRSTP